MHQSFLSYSPILKFFSRDIDFLIVMFLCFFYYAPVQAYQEKEKPFVVILDAGHGGHDSGNRGSGYMEKKIALNIVLKTGKILEKSSGIKIIYTRKKDVFVELIQRANIANKADADLFISVHCDAFTSPKAFGAGTFVLGLHANDRNFKVAQKENAVIFLEDNYEQNYDGFDPNDPESVISLILMQETYLDQSISAASTIQKSFKSNLKRKDRTVKQAGFVVLKYTYMPSVLVETGFLTNPREGAYLNSSKGQASMANAISKAIINYKNKRAASVQDKVVFDLLNETKLYENELKHNIFFKVQIAAGKKSIKLKSYNFRGLKSLSSIKTGNTHRYFYQKTSSYVSAKDYLNEVKSKGYSSAFLVAFDGEKKITISEALGLLE